MRNKEKPVKEPKEKIAESGSNQELKANKVTPFDFENRSLE
jgi:hypothetical protein